MSNVYTAPSADLTTDSGHGETRVFAVNGRIGRVRYYVYLLYGIFCALLLSAIVIGSSAQASGPTYLFRAGVEFLLAASIGILVARRRLQDMDSPWAWSLLSLVPFVNLILWLVLVIAPGTPGDNRYGPKPQPNTTGLVVLAWLLPILIAIFTVIVVVMFKALLGANWGR